MSNIIEVPAVAEPSKEQSDEAAKEELDEAAGDLPSAKRSAGRELCEPPQKKSKQEEIIEVPAVVAEPSKEQSDEAAKEEDDEAGDLLSHKRGAVRDLELCVEPSQKKSKQEEIIEVPAVAEPSKEQSNEAAKEELDEAAGNDLPSHETSVSFSFFKTSKQEIIEVPAVAEPSKEQSDEAAKEELDEAAGNDLPSHGTSVFSFFKTSKQEEITLYHYTTAAGAEGIRRDMKVLQSPPNSGHRVHGKGVYFTSLRPSSDYQGLIKNNFAKRGSPIRNYPHFYPKIKHVVKITFNKNEVEEINDGTRDLYMHRGDVDLSKYKDKHEIYENPYRPR